MLESEEERSRQSKEEDEVGDMMPTLDVLSSYIATGIENVPIFITADNTEQELGKAIG
jgi:hypothetical protein